MPDPSRPYSFPSPASTSYHPPPPPQYYGFPADSPPPIPIGNSAFWQEDEALDYLASGSGFAHDLRAMTPHYAFSVPAFSSASQPVRPPSEHTSHPSYPVPSRPDQWFPALPEELLHAMSDEHMREFAGHMVDSARYMMMSHIGRSPFTVHESARHPHPSHNPQAGQPNVNEPLTPGRAAPVATVGSGQYKPSIMLILSRATTEAIEALEEHKRECPACQLEFEPDNFMAVITCCETAMHVTCLSAWVNSQTYAKSKACMKCRRTIDARRALNNVVPPVSDKNWDENAEFNAPESVKGNDKIELNVSARPERSGGYRRMRGQVYYSALRARRPSMALPEQVNPQLRQTINQLRQQQKEESEEARRQLRLAFRDSNRAYEEDALARRILTDAQTAADQGTVTDLSALRRRCEMAKTAVDKASEVFHKLQAGLDAMLRAHSIRMSPLVEEAWMEHHRARTAAAEEAAHNFSPPRSEGEGGPSNMPGSS